MSEDQLVRRILVADDDPNLRELLVMNLTAEGFEVEAFDNGEDACAHLLTTAPDLVVLDVMMPRRDGLSALRAIRADPRSEHVPVVLLTARATDAEVWEGWESGADYYITKPFNLDELLHFIQYLAAEMA